MNRLKWFERSFAFGQPAAMLPMFLERMDGTLFRIQGKLRNIPDEIMRNQLDGKWSIKQNIGHLAEVEEISLRRVREILNGISPMSPAVFEPTLDYNAMTLDELVVKLSTVRRKNMAQYPGLSDDDLSKTSLHPRLKVNMNPVDLALFHAEHDDHHLVRINEILAHFNYPTPYVSSKLTQDH